MARVPLLSTRDGLTSQQSELFDWIVGSRGTMIRPYEVLMHVPSMARPAAELGHQIRYEGSLSDHDRELAIIAAAMAHQCGFEWDTHVGLARMAGVSESTVSALHHSEGAVDEADRVIVDFVRELCAASKVSDAVYGAAESRLGPAGVVELSTLVGYYTLLAFVMNATEAG